MGLTIRIEGAQAAVRDLRELDDRVHGSMQPLMQSISHFMVETFQHRFDPGGGPPPEVHWAPLDPVTEAIRRRHDHSGKPMLFRRGDLRDSIQQLSHGSDFVEVGTLNPYAADVQEGGTVTRGRGRARELPPRPYVVLGEEDLLDLDHMVVSWFTGADPGELARA